MLKKIKKIRERMLVWLTHKVALPVLLVIRKPKEFPYNLHQLLALPEGTLGRELALFLHANDLHLLRYYEKHDIKHVLFGYPSTEAGEVCLQFFMLGNGHVSFPVLITVTFGALFMPEYYSLFAKAYKRGKQVPSMEQIDWFDLIPVQLKTTQQQLKLIPAV
jgi:ubiquinone biosynthesis protein Coq4